MTFTEVQEVRAIVKNQNVLTGIVQNISHPARSLSKIIPGSNFRHIKSLLPGVILNRFFCKETTGYEKDYPCF